MREILFRGKRTKDGAWVEGYYVYDESGQVTEKPAAYIYHLNNHPCGWNLIQYDVIPATVGQYTGLTDKNGKKIFEGDILGTTNSNSYIWYVDYKNTAFCCNQGNANYSCVLDEFMSVSAVEVIGNIHDNPELIGGNDG